MRIEQYIAAAWARQLNKKIVSDAIAALQAMDSSMTLSGDSGLMNIWEEVCVQVQDEESFFWDAYLETIESLLASYVDMLDLDARMALWLGTDQGQDYIDEQRNGDAGVGDVPVMIEEIVVELKNCLLSAAADFENPRIAKHIARQDDGEDDANRDEDEDEDADSDDDSVNASQDVEVSEGTSSDQQGVEKRFFDLRLGVTNPVIFGICREQIESSEVGSALEFLQSLVPTKNPEHAWAFKGRLTLMISGYDDDSRELFAIPEVCRYIRMLDDQWPFWLFFLNQENESIKVVAMCLATTVEVEPGKVQIDPAGLQHFIERSFAAVNYLFRSYGFPESEKEALSLGVSQIFAASMSNTSLDWFNRG